MSDAWGTLTVPTPAEGGVTAPADRVTVRADGPELRAKPARTEADPPLARRYRQCAGWCGCLVVAIGCIGLIGWLNDMAMLTNLRPGWTAMKVNTTIGLIVAGCALGLHGLHHGQVPLSRRMSRLLAVFIVGLAGATLFEEVSGIDLGIDQLLVVEPPNAVGTVHPGRMAQLTAVTFTIFGLSLFTMASTRSRWQMVSSALALLATVISMVLLLGYVFGAAELYTASGRFQAVAANTSIAFFLLGNGILFTNLPTGVLRSLASPYLGGTMLRRMLPLVVLLMTGIVWLRLLAQSWGMFDSVEFGAASVAVVGIISMGAILIWGARMLDRLDRAQRLGEEAIRRLNVSLDSRLRTLEAANREFQGFSYSMSHVLRAPLRAIHGYAQIVLDDFAEALGVEGRRLLGAMQSNAEEMSELLYGILAFLRLGWQPMAIITVDMDQVARAAIRQLETKTAGRDIRFEIGNLPGVPAEASMMLRLWLNLLDNAVKFTSARDAARIELGARHDGEHITYFVKDNGAGFDMQYVTKLYGVFQRLHDVAQFPGTGIGLAIVNRIIARHGGRVLAEGKVDEGATFYFTLPSGSSAHG